MTRTPASPGRNRAWDSGPRPRRYPVLVVLAALAFALPSAVLTALRVFPPRDDATALLASFIPYAVPGYAVALLLLLVAVVRARRRWPIALTSLAVAALLALQVSWLAPFFVPDRRPAGPDTFTVLSLNLYRGQADPAQLVAAAQQADVVVLVESTDAVLRSLQTLGWDRRFPYSVGDQGAGLSDTAVFSRFPLTGSQLIGPTSFQQWLTTATVPGIGAVRIAGVHPCNPYCHQERWASEHAALRSTLRPLLTTPTVAAGDYNAIDDQGPMIDLRSDGWSSGNDLTGAGWMPTWPANRAYPPLLALDHVLVSPRLTVTAIATVRVAGTDHLGLRATIAPVP